MFSMFNMFYNQSPSTLTAAMTPDKIEKIKKRIAIPLQELMKNRKKRLNKFLFDKLKHSYEAGLLTDQNIYEIFTDDTSLFITNLPKKNILTDDHFEIIMGAIDPIEMINVIYSLHDQSTQFDLKLIATHPKPAKALEALSYLAKKDLLRNDFSHAVLSSASPFEVAEIIDVYCMWNNKDSLTRERLWNIAKSSTPKAYVSIILELKRELNIPSDSLQKIEEKIASHPHSKLLIQIIMAGNLSKWVPQLLEHSQSLELISLLTDIQIIKLPIINYIKICLDFPPDKLSYLTLGILYYLKTSGLFNDTYPKSGSNLLAILTSSNLDRLMWGIEALFHRDSLNQMSFDQAVEISKNITLYESSLNQSIFTNTEEVFESAHSYRR